MISTENKNETGHGAVLVAEMSKQSGSDSKLLAKAEAYEYGAGASVARSRSRGTRRNLIRFNSTHLDVPASVDGDIGGRAILFNSPDSALLSVVDPGIRRDIDRPTGF